MLLRDRPATSSATSLPLSPILDFCLANASIASNVEISHVDIAYLHVEARRLPRRATAILMSGSRRRETTFACPLATRHATRAARRRSRRRPSFFSFYTRKRRRRSRRGGCFRRLAAGWLSALFVACPCNAAAVRSPCVSRFSHRCAFDAPRLPISFADATPLRHCRTRRFPIGDQYLPGRFTPVVGS